MQRLIDFISKETKNALPTHLHLLMALIKVPLVTKNT